MSLFLIVGKLTRFQAIPENQHQNRVFCENLLGLKVKFKKFIHASSRILYTVIIITSINNLTYIALPRS